MKQVSQWPIFEEICKNIKGKTSDNLHHSTLKTKMQVEMIKLWEGTTEWQINHYILLNDDICPTEWKKPYEVQMKSE